jgi:hypothetical protein
MTGAIHRVTPLTLNSWSFFADRLGYSLDNRTGHNVHQIGAWLLLGIRSESGGRRSGVSVN